MTDFVLFTVGVLTLIALFMAPFVWPDEPPPFALEEPTP